jgi:hypothetical protein
MIPLLLFFLQLIIIFLLAKSFSKNFYKFWFLLTKSNSFAFWMTSIFLLPGTLLHELSHWLMAEIMQVPTGELNIIPKREKEAKYSQLGSMQIAKTDPFRRTLIGIAPFITGMSLITILIQYFPDISQVKENLLLFIILLLAILIIQNTMFSSKKDLQAAFVPVAFFLILAFLFWWFEIPIHQKIVEFVNNSVTKLNSVFIIIIGIDIVLLLLVKVLTLTFGKILKRKIV